MGLFEVELVMMGFDRNGGMLNWEGRLGSDLRAVLAVFPFVISLCHFKFESFCTIIHCYLYSRRETSRLLAVPTSIGLFSKAMLHSNHYDMVG